MEAKEEIRSRLNIEDVIGEYVILKRAGRNFKGLSPFSGEKTPSFIVSPEKQIWHDFSSGKGGDVFSFIMEVEGLTFREALDNLARKAGVEIADFENKNSQQVARQKQRLLDINEKATHFFQYYLAKDKDAIDYVFKKRKLSKQVVMNFRIGYAPDSKNALVNYLRKKGYSQKELEQAGVVNRFGGDLFKGRITIPLMDSTGRVIGFTGRILKDDPRAPKYLNTPQTMLYDKSRHVFGLSQAKDTIRKKDYAVVVEGNLDVVSAHQAGYSEVVATAGTAMTDQHLKILNRFSGNMKLSFDSDKAGISATERAIPIAEKVGVELKIISLPEGYKDPDELIKADENLWKKAIEDAIPVIDWVLRQYAKNFDIKAASGKRDFTTAGLRLIKNIDDPVMKDHYMNLLEEKIGTSRDVLEFKMENLARENEVKRIKKINKNNLSKTKISEDLKREQKVICALVASKESRQKLAGLKEDTFSSKENQMIAEFLRDNPNDSFDIIPEKLQEIETYVKIIQVESGEMYSEMSSEDKNQEAISLLRQMVIRKKEKEKNLLQKQLSEAEQNGDDETATKLLEKIGQIIKEINSGKR